MEPFEIRLAPAPLCARELTALYTAVGWNADGRRTPERTAQMLGAALGAGGAGAPPAGFYAGALRSGRLVGFGRVLGDVYAAQILDVLTHPDERRRGIASRVVGELVRHCHAQGRGLMLVDGSGVAGFYERFGFRAADPRSNRLLYWSEPVAG